MGIGLQRIGQNLDGRDGLLGAALTGALAVVVATPCAGPFMAGAIGFALVQPPLAALAIFAALAVGVAAPFTILSFSPGLARRLPRPGPWMSVLKQALAFPLFGAAAWLLWVFSLQTGSAGLALLLGCALLLGVAGWLFGIAQRRGMAGRSSRGLYAAAAMGLGAIAQLGALPGSVLYPVNRAELAQAATALPPPMEVKPVAWSPERVAQERTAGHAVFVDFSAAWCLTCKVNEKAVLSTDAFKNAVSRTGTSYMVADSTNYDARIEEAMMKLGRSGLPLYLLYPAKGGDPVILPQLLDVKTAVAALERAAGPKG